MDVGPRIVASRIWAVLNPQIEHCENELEVLARTITFRGYNEQLERLRPLRQVLLPEGREIFDDLRGEIADYDRAVKTHDDAVAALESRARGLFRAVVDDPAFQDAVAGLTSLDRAPEDTRYLAEYVVNGTGDLPASYELCTIWNANRESLKQAAPPTLRDELVAERRRFLEVVTTTRDALRALRKEWSRKHDIPVAPVPGIAIEATAP